jgi:hypothetical protein
MMYECLSECLFDLLQRGGSLVLVKKYREFCGSFCGMPDVLVCQDLGFSKHVFE